MDPKKLRKLREDIAALDAEATKILEMAAGREGAERKLSKEETDRIKAIKAERAELASLVTEAEAVIATAKDALSRALPADRVDGSPAKPPAGDQAQAAARALLPGVNPFGGLHGHPAERLRVGAFQGIGDFFAAMARTAIAHQRHQGEPDPRIEEMGIAAADGRTSAEVPSDGSSLVGLQYAQTLLSRAWEIGQIFNRCSFQGIGDGYDGVSLPMVDEKSRADGQRYGGISVYWLADAVPPTATHPKIDVDELRLKDLGGLVRVPEKLLRDATALGSYIMRALPEELIFRVEDAIIRANGKGKPLGILDPSCSATVTIAKEVGQTADTILAKNTEKMFTAFKPMNRANAAWFINQEDLPQLLEMNVEIGTAGQLVYMPPGGLSGSPYGTLYGLPVIPIEHCSKLGDRGDILVSDLSEYLVIRKPGMDFASSMFTWFDTFDMGFRWKLELNGQPLLKSAITPKHANAGFKVSPFVTLAERA